MKEVTLKKVSTYTVFEKTFKMGRTVEVSDKEATYLKKTGHFEVKDVAPEAPPEEDEGAPEGPDEDSTAEKVPDVKKAPAKGSKKADAQK